MSGDVVTNVYKKELGSIFNTALPTSAWSDLFTASLQPSDNPSIVNVYCSFGTGVYLRMKRTKSGDSETLEYLNAYTQLSATSAYMFTVVATYGEYLNFGVSPATSGTTSGTTLSFYVVESNGAI
jgi:hypothetical protein